MKFLALTLYLLTRITLASISSSVIISCFKTSFLRREFTVACTCQIFRFYYDTLLGRPILNQEVLFHIRTSYFTLGRPISRQDLLFYIRTSYFTLGRPILHCDVLFYIRTSYLTLGRPTSHQDVLFHIRVSYFTLGRPISY